MKERVIREVEKILEESGYQYNRYSACFDIAAKRDSLILIKVLTNVDSLQRQQAENLKIISSHFNAKCLVVGDRTRKNRLENDVIYKRFGVPTVRPDTFESIIKQESDLIVSDRGGYFVRIDPSALRSARKNAELTQKQLAEKIDVNKKTIYEHEREEKKANIEIVNKIEKVLGNIRKPVSISNPAKIEKTPKKKTEKIVYDQMKKLGFSVTSVKQAPFNMIAQSKRILVSDIENDMRRMKRYAPRLDKFSDITEESVAFVSDDIEKKNVSGVPIVKKKEVEKAKNEKELMKIVKERE